MVAVIGGPDFDRLEQLLGRSLAELGEDSRDFPGVHEAALDEICIDWLRTRDKSAAVDQAQEVGLHWAVVNTIGEFLESEQVKARSYVAGAEDSSLGWVKYLGSPFMLNGSQWRTPDLSAIEQAQG
jgi:crotonobetainyl-CoA:carnitine CoA-transferase CaiB-like acyl-CoA transferase